MDIPKFLFLKVLVPKRHFNILSISLLISLGIFLSLGCSKDEISQVPVGDGDIIIEARDHNNSGFASARGIIPSGEYAGERFSVRIRGEYSGLGIGTLISGDATIRIGRDVFSIVVDPSIPSFCCGSGDLQNTAGFREFSVSGWVEHTTESGLHSHLFGASATSEGIFNFNIVDQTNSVACPDPCLDPHDPGIGKIFEIPAQTVRIHIE